MAARVPPYFDRLIEGFRAGHAGRHVHLGHWSDPPALATPPHPGEFEAAQARLTQWLIEQADLRSGQRLLDVGCGFGGALEEAARQSALRLVGINIDRRQLEVCRSLSLGDSTLSLVAADACALPFKAESFDRMLCIEAMFHFTSRREFFRQAATVLRPGGRLVLSDILLGRPARTATLQAAAIETILRGDYGPWPELWMDERQLVALAADAGLTVERAIDVTRETLPTYRITAPQAGDDLPANPPAGSVLRWLHTSGHLTYLCMVLTRP